MYDVAITNSTRLDVAYHPVHIVFLTPSGLLPDSVSSETQTIEPKLQVFRELPPSNLTENTLMSMWLNTHQAMFLSTGMAAHCTSVATGFIREQGAVQDIYQYLEMARDARMASAAYTGLPHLSLELYEVYIRESMRLVHPGFSGVSNQESVAMEKKLHDLKQAQRELVQRDADKGAELAPWFDGLYQADRKWWRFHGHAMNKYVTTPISLARLDFAKKQDAANDFEEYRTKILRDDKVQLDYDRYFAIERMENLTLEDYRSQLTACLERSEPYVDSDGELAQHRVEGNKALFNILDVETQRLGRASA
jgi:hypothetical protein